MIGKLTKGSDFRGCIAYAFAEKEKNKEVRLLDAEGVMTDSIDTITMGMEAQRHLNKGVEKWCGHVSLNYSPEDTARLTDKAMVALAHEYMQLMGIRNTQYVIVRHLDHDHAHCHIVYNRVANDGTCIDDSFERLRNKEICRKLKEKYGLTFGKGKDKVNLHRLKGRDKTRQEIYIALREALKTATDWTTFQRELLKSGVTVKKKYKRGTTEVQGLSFMKDGAKFKASEIDKKRRFGYTSICRELEKNASAKEKKPLLRDFRIAKDEERQLATTPNRAVAETPSPAATAIEATLEVAETIVEGVGMLGDLFQTGPGFDPEEEEFRRRINPKKKKKGRKL